MNTDKEPVPTLLTVMQAAWVLGIGRTKAYDMTLEWRATGGKSGMCVIKVRGQLRVPRAWLEKMIGAPIEYVPDPSDLSKPSKSRAA